MSTGGIQTHEDAHTTAADVVLGHMTRAVSDGGSDGDSDGDSNIEIVTSDDEAPLQSTISHLLQFHSNKATGFVDDIRDFTRPWRRRLRDILFRENEEYVKFLEKPVDVWPGMEQHRTFFEELVRQTSSLGTSWLDRHVNVFLDDAARRGLMSELDCEVAAAGGGLGGLRTQILHIMDNYLATLNRLFAHNAALEHKVRQLSRLTTQIKGLDFLEGDVSEEAKDLQISALKFIQSKYAALGIREDYIGFCREYARFQAYRSVLGAVQAGSDTHGVPLCSICTSGAVVAALTPCGHVYCNACAQKQRSHCYICRTAVNGVLRIYFN
jgi:hypothetical protein